MNINRQSIGWSRMIYDKYIESNHVDRPYAIRDLPTHFLWRYIEFRSLGPPYEYYLLKNKFNWDRIVLHYFGKFGRVPHFNVQMSILTSEAAHRSREGTKTRWTDQRSNKGLSLRTHSGGHHGSNFNEILFVVRVWVRRILWAPRTTNGLRIRSFEIRKS